MLQAFADLSTPLLADACLRLPRIVGCGNAMWIINTGLRVDATRAFEAETVDPVMSEPDVVDVSHVGERIIEVVRLEG